MLTLSFNKLQKVLEVKPGAPLVPVYTILQKNNTVFSCAIAFEMEVKPTT